MTEVIVPDTYTTELETIIAAASAAAPIWAQTSRADRADAIDAVAAALDANIDELVEIAGHETHLTEARLRGEVGRTTFQLRFFANIARDGSYLDVHIDHADTSWQLGGGRADLRRIHIPFGPLVNFAASNFPFAFSVAGGDTASALAAGCPVIVKAHSGHAELSVRTGEIVREALEAAGAPDGVFNVIFGTEAGVAALRDPRIKVGSFTGSIGGGRVLFDIANARPEPIPFFGELGSVNPVFVMPSASQARAGEIASGLLANISNSAGQMCTKPGLLFVPRGSEIIAELQGHAAPAPHALLNDRIHSGYIEILQRLQQHDGVETLLAGGDVLAEIPAPTVLKTDISTVFESFELLTTECFGPAALVVEYDTPEQLLQVADSLEGQLTATIFAEDTAEPAGELVFALTNRAGRVLWNQWSAGAAVTFAQNHGGPYPATTAAGTAIGAGAIGRFVRAVTYQNFPQELLPEELRDGAEIGSRTVNGVREIAG
ncbi:MAG: aldehyde dehydrogenase family protein [Microbacteriaceae bacterium]|nr:aldehyde dehydrogenase family protein [Microbacteriaceae bacterium]